MNRRQVLVGFGVAAGVSQLSLPGVSYALPLSPMPYLGRWLLMPTGTQQDMVRTRINALLPDMPVITRRRIEEWVFDVIVPTPHLDITEDGVSLLVAEVGRPVLAGRLDGSDSAWVNGADQPELIRFHLTQIELVEALHGRMDRFTTLRPGDNQMVVMTRITADRFPRALSFSLTYQLVP